MKLIEINLSLQADTTTAALAAWETLTRAAAGFAFDGIHAEISIDRLTIDDDADDPVEHADTEGDQ